MLAYALLTAVAVVQRRDHPALSEPVALTRDKPARLHHALLALVSDAAHGLTRPLFRRCHQAFSRQCHYL
ncbi:hypothetical protein NORO109296_10780 [Nocardiopsis rhodophaea]